MRLKLITIISSQNWCAYAIFLKSAHTNVVLWLMSSTRR